jgi:TetR/AcrR family transcriptional regulator of autoinduction and epiphytic fitness
MKRTSFRQQMLLAREQAIVACVNRLLAEKGYDQMTVDEVAAEVGIAKASLYKHFPSKEALAAAAMIDALDRTLVFIKTLSAEKRKASDQLRSVVRWVMLQSLEGEMPSLPAQNSALREALASSRDYMNKLMEVSEHLGGWIGTAQKAREINPKLPPEVVLYTLFARACDPVLQVLKMGRQYSHEQIADWLLTTCFDGLK